MEENTTEYTVEATQTSLTLFEALVDAEAPCGVTELAESVGVSKSVVHNHLSTLRSMGYVTKQGQEYVPSLRALNVGDRIRERSSIYRQARSHVDGLANASGEVASLFILEERYGVPVHIGHARDTNPPYRLGERVPLHVSAPGKAILASLPDDEIASLLDGRRLDAATADTVTDPDELRHELRRIQDDGVAFCREEHLEGYVGVAAPIDVEGQPRPAALGVVGPKDRLTGRYLEEDVTGQVIRTARSIQVELTEET